MNSFSSVTLVGRLTRDAEMRTTAGDNPNTLVRFSVAVDRRRRDGDGFVEEPSFFNVSYFGQRASAISVYLQKGLLVGVTGELQQRKYVDREGREVSTIDIIANNVHLIESKSMREQRVQQEGGGSSSSFSPSSSSYNQASKGGYSNQNSNAGKVANNGKENLATSDFSRFEPEKSTDPDDFTEGPIPF